MKVKSPDPIEPSAFDVAEDNAAGRSNAGKRQPGRRGAEQNGAPRGSHTWGFLKTRRGDSAGQPALPDHGGAQRVRVAMSSGPFAKTDETAPSGIGSVPNSRQTAPARIYLGAAVNGRLQKLAGESQEASEKNVAAYGVNGLEYGGTICETSGGKLLQPDTQIGTEAGRLRMNLKDVPEGCKLVAFFHYHPVLNLNDEHGYTFSGTDFFTFTDKKELNAFVVQSKNGEQYALLRTGDTPASIEGKQFEGLYTRYLLRAGKLQFQRGMSYSKALQIAASEMAKYGTKMAYYEGRDGVLERFDREEPDARGYWEAPYNG